MKRKGYLLFFVLLAATAMARVLKTGEANAQNQSSRGPKVTVREGEDLSAFSEEERQSLGTLAGEFVFSGLKGKENLKLPDGMRALYIDNDEMYYAVRRQQYFIDAIGVWDTGQIKNLSLQKIVLHDIQKLSKERLQLKAYIKLSYQYTDDPEQRQSGVGEEVVMTLLKDEDGRYRIEKYSEYSSEYIMMRDDFHYFRKELIQKGITDEREIIDRYFAERLSDLQYGKSLEGRGGKDQEHGSQEEIIDDTSYLLESSPAGRLSVNYDRNKAAIYANHVGTWPDLIFYRITLDCTNFVSQAIWIGYGGDKGNFNKWLNTYPNAEYLAKCQLWADEKYRMAPGENGWWGASKFRPSFHNPSEAWMQVETLWSYLSPTSTGPRANKYNYGQHYSNSTLVILPGDVLQFSKNPANGYSHSVVVVNNANQTLNGHSNIYVAQHTGDYGWRKLSDVITSAGAYIRIIRPISGSFTE